MDKVQPVLRRRYCVCGRVCGDAAVKPDTARDSAAQGASNAPSTDASSGLRAEKPAPPSATSERPPSATGDTLTLLQLKVRALEKYKTSYELLCSQLAELNTQVGLQLQRHEVDVATLHSTITALQTTNATLQEELQTTKQQLQSLQTASDKDREYAGGVHKQLTTVAELLRAAEKRLKEQEAEHQRETVRHKETRQEITGLAADKEKLETQIQTLQAQLVKASESEKLRRKYRTETKHLQVELEQLRDELEQQRAMTRHTKRQLKHTRDERDALAKQLEHIKSDGSQFTAILEAQREEMARHDKKAQRWKKQSQETEVALQETQQSLEDAEAQLARLQEELVSKNARVEQLVMEGKDIKQRLDVTQSEAKAADIERGNLRVQLERVQREYETYKLTQSERAVRKDEETAREMQRKYQTELEQMKQLLSLNQQRTTESSHDMQVLKQELGSVQLLLRSCHRQKRKETVSSDGRSECSDDQRAWRLRHHREQVEKAVLTSAIMEQVNEAW